MGWLSWLTGTGKKLDQKGPQPVAVPDDRRPAETHYRRDPQGLLGWLRDSLFGWWGRTSARGTRAEEEVVTEKVRSGPQGVVRPWFLPYPDDQSGETAGMRLAYRQMFRDPNVKAALLSKILSVCALDLNIIPADKANKKKRAKKSERNDEQARKNEAVAEFIRWNLNERIQGCLPELAWNILSGGLIDGYSVNEKIWHHEERGQYRGRYILTALKPKDTGNDVVLQTDEYLNVVGVQTLRYNAGEIYAPANFVIWSHLPFFGRPTGTSDLRAAYRAYLILDAVHKLRAMGLEKRALPVLLGTYQDSADRASLEATLARVRSQSWLSLPEGVKVEALNIAGMADEAFGRAIEDLREEIFIAVMGATLQNLTGQQGSVRGNSKVHKSTADLFRWYLARALEVLLNDADTGLIRDIVDLNEVVTDYPRAVLGAIDTSDLLVEAQLDAALVQLGLKLSKEELYEKYSRTPPDPDDPDDALGPPGQGPGGPGAPGEQPGHGTNIDSNTPAPTFAEEHYDEEFESKHTRGEGGKFSRQAAVKQAHEEGKEKIRQDYQAEVKGINAEHKEKKAALQESRRAKILAEKEKGRKKLRAIKAKQARLADKITTLKDEQNVASRAKEMVDDEIQKAHERGGYTAEALEYAISPARLDESTAADTRDSLQDLLDTHPWDPADDEDFDQNASPDEMAKEKADRAEARQVVVGLLAKMKKAAALGEKVADHDDKIGDLEGESMDLDDQRAEVVEAVNERIGEHRDRHDELHQDLKDKTTERRQKALEKAQDAHQEHHSRSQEALEEAREQDREEHRQSRRNARKADKKPMQGELFAEDSGDHEWDESKHPRSRDGRFGHSGGGGSSTGKKPRRTDKEQARREKVENLPEGDDEDWTATTGDMAPVAERYVKSEKARDEARKGFLARCWSFLHELAGAAKDTLGAVGSEIAAVGSDLCNAMPASIRGVLDTVHDAGSGLLHGLGVAAQQIGAAAVWLDHHILSVPGRYIQRLAKEAGRAKGLDDDQVEKLGKVLQTTDSIFAWGVNIPLAHTLLEHGAELEGLASFGLAKLAYFLPVASLLYVAYAAATTNPLAMLQAAGRALSDGSEKHAESVAGPLYGEELADALAQRWADAGENSEWYQALFAAAFDKTHDARRALQMADDAFEREPDGESLADEVEPDEMEGLLDDYSPPEATDNGYQSDDDEPDDQDDEDDFHDEEWESFAAEDWAPYVGPRGGNGFRNTKTGRVVYQATAPGSGGGRKKQPAAQEQKPAEQPTPEKKPARKKEPAAKKPKADPAVVGARLKELAGKEGGPSAEDVHEAMGHLAGLTLPQIAQVAQSLGAGKLKGKKAEQVASLAQKALAKVQEQKKEPAEKSQQKPAGHDPAERLRSLYENITDSAVATTEAIEGAYKELVAANLPATKITALARGVGILRKLPNKEAYLKAIRNKILERKGLFDRANYGLGSGKPDKEPDKPAETPAPQKGKVLYSGVVLDHTSRQRLLAALKDQIPSGWREVAHHMTHAFGKELPAELTGKKGNLRATHVGFDPDLGVLAVKVESDIPSENETPHVTVAVGPTGKPVNSNKIKTWKKLDQAIPLTGEAQNVHAQEKPQESKKPAPQPEKKPVQKPQEKKPAPQPEPAGGEDALHLPDDDFDMKPGPVSSGRQEGGDELHLPDEEPDLKPQQQAARKPVQKPSRGKPAGQKPSVEKTRKLRPQAEPGDAPPEHVEEARQAILDAAGDRPVVSIPELRRQMPARLQGAAFDLAIFHMLDNGHAQGTQDMNVDRADPDSVRDGDGVLSSLAINHDHPANQRRGK